MWKFIKSSSNKLNWLEHNQKEFCFIGRSNVGKSTLINLLANQNKLAKTSKFPGRTQLINYFETEDKKIIIDLPGYGYAKISYSEQERMFSMVDEFFRLNKPEVVFVLIDAKIGITSKDEEIIEYLDSLNHNIKLILTKVDKANQSELSKTLKHPIVKDFEHFRSSIENEKYIEKIREYIKNY